MAMAATQKVHVSIGAAGASGGVGGSTDMGSGVTIGYQSTVGGGGGVLDEDAADVAAFRNVCPQDVSAFADPLDEQGRARAYWSTAARALDGVGVDVAADMFDGHAVRELHSSRGPRAPTVAETILDQVHTKEATRWAVVQTAHAEKQPRLVSDSPYRSATDLRPWGGWMRVMAFFPTVARCQEFVERWDAKQPGLDWHAIEAKVSKAITRSADGMNDLGYQAYRVARVAEQTMQRLRDSKADVDTRKERARQEADDLSKVRSRNEQHRVSAYYTELNSREFAARRGKPSAAGADTAADATASTTSAQDAAAAAALGSDVVLGVPVLAAATNIDDEDDGGNDDDKDKAGQAEVAAAAAQEEQVEAEAEAAAAAGPAPPVAADGCPYVVVDAFDDGAVAPWLQTAGPQPRHHLPAAAGATAKPATVPSSAVAATATPAAAAATAPTPLEELMRLPDGIERECVFQDVVVALEPDEETGEHVITIGDAFYTPRESNDFMTDQLGEEAVQACDFHAMPTQRWVRLDTYEDRRVQHHYKDGELEKMMTKRQKEDILSKKAVAAFAKNGQRVPTMTLKYYKDKGTATFEQRDENNAVVRSAFLGGSGGGGSDGEATDDESTAPRPPSASDGSTHPRDLIRATLERYGDDLPPDVVPVATFDPVRDCYVEELKRVPLKAGPAEQFAYEPSDLDDDV